MRKKILTMIFVSYRLQQNDSGFGRDRIFYQTGFRFRSYVPTYLPTDRPRYTLVTHTDKLHIGRYIHVNF